MPCPPPILPGSPSGAPQPPSAPRNRPRPPGRRRLAAWLLAAACAAVAAPAGADRPRPGPNPAALGPVPGEVIVKFKPGAALTRQYALSARAQPAAVRAMLAERATAVGARLGRTLHAGAAGGTDIQVLRATDMSAAELAARLAADPDIEWAEPNERLQRTAAPNDPLYPASPTERRSNGSAQQDGPLSGQWYLRAPAATLAQGPVSAIDIEAAWARTRGSGNIVVAVLDTGVRPEHPDLAGQLVGGYDFVEDTAISNDGNGRDSDASDPGDWVTSAEAGVGALNNCRAANSSWHGTSTASLVAAKADDGIGMAGAAPGVKVLPVRVLGKCYGSSLDIQAAMRWAAGISVPGVPDNPNPAKVLNLSLGGSSSSCSPGYQAAVDEVLARGAVIVAAAGNSAGGPVGSPANCRGVIAVAGLRHAGTKVGFSDLGPQITLGAPAGNCINVGTGEPCLFPVLAATNSGTRGPLASGWTDSYDITVGTSFASPLVAATAALMYSLQPAMLPAQAVARLQATVRPHATTGGDNAIVPPLPVRRCDEPNRFNEATNPRDYGLDLQCYCTTSTCGAGMLDAGGAVRAVVQPVARLSVVTATPTAGSTVQLSGTGSLPPLVGSAVLGYQWRLVDGGGVVTGFSGPANASTASVVPSAAGSFTVELTVTDAQGVAVAQRQAVTVAAAPPAAPTPAPATPPAVADPPSGGGGGSTSLPWLLLLMAAVAALFRAAPASGRA